MMDDNIDNTVKSNESLYNYFDASRISSGDIGNQNTNSGGYGTSQYGGNGTNGKGGQRDPSQDLIPMISQGARNRVECAHIPAINPKKGVLTTEHYRNMIEDIESDDINRIDYIERERFTTSNMLNDKSVQKLIKIIIIVLGIFAILYCIYGKTNYWVRPNYVSNVNGWQ